MGKIEALTAEQLARIPDFIEEWSRFSLCTEPADRPRAEAAINLIYDRLEPPGLRFSKQMREWVYGEDRIAPLPRIRWTGSPFWSERERARCGKVQLAISERIHLQYEKAEKIVQERASKAVFDHVQSCFEPAYAPTRDVGQFIAWSLDRADDFVYGQHMAVLLAPYAYFQEVCGIDLDCLQGLFELSRSCGWLLPHEETCWVSERHSAIHRDWRGRLHAKNGPAIAFRDNGSGSIYATKGRLMPKPTRHRVQPSPPLKLTTAIARLLRRSA